MIVPSRRSFITGIASLIAAPALVRASSLMQIRGEPLWGRDWIAAYNIAIDALTIRSVSPERWQRWRETGEPVGATLLDRTGAELWIKQNHGKVAPFDPSAKMVMIDVPYGTLAPPSYQMKRSSLHDAECLGLLHLSGRRLKT